MISDTFAMLEKKASADASHKSKKEAELSDLEKLTSPIGTMAKLRAWKKDALGQGQGHHSIIPMRRENIVRKLPVFNPDFFF